MEKAALAQLLEEKCEEKSMLNRDFSMFGMEKAALAQLLEEKYERKSMLNRDFSMFSMEKWLLPGRRKRIWLLSRWQGEKFKEKFTLKCF